MEILKIKNDNFILSVNTNDIIDSYKSAKLKNIYLDVATKYIFNDPSCSLKIIDIHTNNLIDLELEQPYYPIFFENKAYTIDIEFLKPLDDKPELITNLLEVKQGIVNRKVKGIDIVTFVLNFGNDIGETAIQFNYAIDQLNLKNIFSFEVFPTKLDYKNDYKKIVSDINNEFSGLVLDILRKSYHGLQSGGDVKNDLVWWSVFSTLYDKIIIDSNFILNKPHNKLISTTQIIKAYKIKNVDPRLEEYIKENINNPNKYYEVKEKRLTVDTQENRLFKYIITKCFQKFFLLKSSFMKSALKDKASPDFISSLEKIELKLKVILKNPFFKVIGNYKGVNLNSLVLQKASGYASLFRSWLILSRGISFLEGFLKLEFKSIADLYQIWCFLEIKNIVKNILNEDPEHLDLTKYVTQGFNTKFLTNNSSKVRFNNQGDTVELFHELKFRNDNTIKAESSLSYTTEQIPDIVLRITKNDLDEPYVFTYCFDAKYRIDIRNGIDNPPEDAINQMHRYRDSIFYKSKDMRPKKEIIGAYVLFPGTTDIDVVKKSFYYKSVDEINIGAFPFVPNDSNILLFNFIEKILDKKSAEVLNEDVISQKGMNYEDPDSLVLIGSTSSREQKEYFKQEGEKVYHIPVIDRKRNTHNLKRLSKIKYFSPNINGIYEYYEVIDIQIKPRKEVPVPFSSGHADEAYPYYVLYLRNKKHFDRRLKYKGAHVYQYKSLSEIKERIRLNVLMNNELVL